MRLFGTLLMPLLVASCAAAPQAPSAGVPGTPPIRTCNPAAAQRLVGRVADAKTLDEAKRLAGATQVRLLRPHIPRAMNFESGRLNVSVDRSGRILELSCG